MKQFLPYIELLMVIITVACWGLLFLYGTPQLLIEYIGVENGYILMMILAFISGLSIFGTAPYHLVLIAFAAGGLNPWLLAVSAACGLTIGDTTSYFLGYQSRTIVPRWIEPFIAKISHFIETHTKHLSLYIFLYGACIPFSNDFIGVTMGIMRYPYWRVIIPLTLGTFVFNSALALAAPHAYDFLVSFFT